MEAEVSYIPALPGYKTVTLRDGQPFFTPVISWEHVLEPRLPQIGGKCLMVYPVTPGGSHHEDYVLYPDGTVRGIDETYNSVEDWHRAMMDHAEMLRLAREVKERASDRYILHEEEEIL